MFELAGSLNQLRGSRSYGELRKAAKARGDRLADSTLNNMLRGKVVPTRPTVVAYLTACGLDAEAQRPWLAARDRVAMGYQRAPAGAVRVREARPRLLGVHASIQVEPGGDPEDLPPFVPRDMQDDLRTAIIAAAQHGGFVLLVGGSSVGKTRVLYETVRAELPEWWLVHAADGDAVRHLAAEPSPRTVVWLDELQRYLDGSSAMPAAARALVATGAVIVSTIWAAEYGARTADPQAGQPDLYGNDRELLRLAHVFSVAEDLSSAERRRAEALAADRRIRTALDTSDAGFAQILAAGPDLVRHWEQAPHDQCYGQAVITAAVDACRIGAAAPLSRKFLEAAAPAYLTGRQRAEATPDWVDWALAYATSVLRGASSPLSPIAVDMGEIAGYVVADYLRQHTSRTRRAALMPDGAWQALVAHHHPDDAFALGYGAERRMRYREAEELYRAAGGAGESRTRLGLVMALNDRIDEALVILDPLARSGDPMAVREVVDLLTRLDRPAEILDVLRAAADSGDAESGLRLSTRLVDIGQVDEAVAVLRPFAASDATAADRLVALLLEQDQSRDAIVVLRQRHKAGDDRVTRQLVDLLAGADHADEAEDVLRTAADRGDWSAAGDLADRLANRGDLAGLLDRADGSDQHAAIKAAELLASQSQVDEAAALLSRYGDRGYELPAYSLITMLTAQARYDDAVAVVRRSVAAWQINSLVEAGNLDEAESVAEKAHADGVEPAAIVRLTERLLTQGQTDRAIDLLRRHAEAGDDVAGLQLVRTLVDHGRVDELRRRADRGDPIARSRLAPFLADRRDVEELRQRSDSGDIFASMELVRMLAEHGSADELSLEVHAGTPGAAGTLRDLQRHDHA